ncbi:hypothetical protein ABEG70_15910 [Pantoea agglomerans]|uniref:hypothetical protein n=1 Tax=Enterobacter agglomerans TaxID=549 RepID=UPI003209B8EA
MEIKALMCFKTGWAILLDAQYWIKWSGIYSNVATILAVIVAAIAAVIAFYQLHSSRIESRRSTANQIYQQYLAMCIEHPNFSLGMNKPVRRSKEYTQYCWFVSSMLFSFEQILEVNSFDKKWISTIESQLSRHEKHLKSSSSVRNGQWEENLDLILKRVIT